MLILIVSALLHLYIIFEMTISVVTTDGMRFSALQSRLHLVGWRTLARSRYQRSVPPVLLACVRTNSELTAVFLARAPLNYPETDIGKRKTEKIAPN